VRYIITQYSMRSVGQIIGKYLTYRMKSK